MDDYEQRFGFEDNDLAVRYVLIDQQGRLQGSVEYIEHDEAVRTAQERGGCAVLQRTYDMVDSRIVWGHDLWT